MRPSAVLLCLGAAVFAGACWYGDPAQVHDPDPGDGPNIGLPDGSIGLPDGSVALPDGSIRLPDGGVGLPDGGPWPDAGMGDGGFQVAEGCHWESSGTLALGTTWAAAVFPVLPLPDGRALFALGPPATAHPSGAVRYEPATGSMVALSQQPRVSRVEHGAVRLSDGLVLYVGGYLSGRAPGELVSATEAELREGNGAWSFVGAFPPGEGSRARLFRQPALAALLPDGALGALPSGGALVMDRGSIEVPLLWNRASASFTPVALPPRSPQGFALMTLPDGRVLLAGGTAKLPGSTEVDPAYALSWLFDPATRQWTQTGSLTAPRADATAVLLSDNRVLLVGGYSAASLVAGAEVYDPRTGRWTPTSGLPAAGNRAAAAVLRDGRVLVVPNTGLTLRTDLYVPTANAWRRGPDVRWPRTASGLAAVDDGSSVRAVVAGGWSAAGAPLSQVERLVCP